VQQPPAVLAVEVRGQTPSELEARAKEAAAEFFGSEVKLVVAADYEAVQEWSHYRATVRVRVAT